MTDLERNAGDRLTRELDWNLLRTFVAIVQEGGITPAANRLLLKQPTVSNALKRLEDRLQKRLIDRGPGHFQLTDAGEALFQDAVEIHGSISRLTVTIPGMTEAVRGHIRIGMASHVVFPPYDHVLQTFSRAHPSVTYDVSVDTSLKVASMVLEKKASFGIGLVYEQHPKLDYHPLYTQQFGFFCGPEHRFFGRQDLTLEDLAGEPSVSFSTDQLNDALRPVALLRAQIKLDDTIRATSAHLEEVRRLINAGVGIGPLPVHVVERDVAQGLLWRLPPFEAPPKIEIYLVTNPTTRLNRAEAGFLDCLKSHIASLPSTQRHYPNAD